MQNSPADQIIKKQKLKNGGSRRRLVSRCFADYWANTFDVIGDRETRKKGEEKKALSANAHWSALWPDTINYIYFP